MPTAMWKDGARYFFYSNEGGEPAHIHVVKGSGTAKFWLRDVHCVHSRGLNQYELNRIERTVVDNLNYLLEVWDGFFNGSL